MDSLPWMTDNERNVSGKRVSRNGGKTVTSPLPPKDGIPPPTGPDPFGLDSPTDSELRYPSPVPDIAVDHRDEMLLMKERGVPRLLYVMRRLRDPDTGCPWDIEQTFDTIAPYTIEEAYEVADAIDRKDWGELKGELGDLLLQVVYHAAIAEEERLFDFDGVAERIAWKMVERHPHIFGGENREKSAEQQSIDWETQKAKERGNAGTLDGVALGLPALLRAVKLQKRAARVGFDWPSSDEVIDKIVEEADELRAESDPAKQVEEFGDLLFVMANLARHLRIDPEAALRAANSKFTRRFEAIESELAEQGRRPEDSTLEEMDALWDRAKAAERSGTSD